MNEQQIETCKTVYHNILFEMPNYCEAQIFTYSSLEDLGSFFFNRLVTTIPGATEDLVKFVIKAIEHRRTAYESDADYYLTLCKHMHYESVPKGIYIKLLRSFVNLFRIKYKKAIEEITFQIAIINASLNPIPNQIKTVSNTSNLEKKFNKDITSVEEQLYLLNRECKDLRTQKEMLQFCQQYITDSLMEFCDFQDSTISLQVLREKALEYAKGYGQLSQVFSYYDEVISLTLSNVRSPFRIFYIVKQYKFIDIIRKKAYSAEYKEDKDVVWAECKKEIDELPKTDELYYLKENNAEEYLEKLKILVSKYDVLMLLNADILASVCLSHRKEILLEALSIFQQERFGLFNNIIPIQLEGMFGDFLKDTTTFRRFTDMNVYPNAVLRDKIQNLRNLKVQLYPEAVLYFNFYFNNNVRNVIAHGNFNHIFSNPMQAEIFSYELLQDLNFLTHMLIRNSETEKMFRFIHGYKEYYEKLISGPNPHFGALLNDLLGKRTHMDYDAINIFNPIQMVYWIVNPYYEKLYEQVADKSELLNLRADLLSEAFWNYVLQELKSVISAGYDYKNIGSTFQSIAKGLFSCTYDANVKRKLADVSRELKSISQF